MFLVKCKMSQPKWTVFWFFMTVGMCSWQMTSVKSLCPKAQNVLLKMLQFGTMSVPASREPNSGCKCGNLPNLKLNYASAFIPSYMNTYTYAHGTCRNRGHPASSTQGAFEGGKGLTQGPTVALSTRVGGGAAPLSASSPPLRV